MNAVVPQDGRQGPAPPIPEQVKRDLRIPYALHRVPESAFSTLLPPSASPQPGDIALARLEKLGRNTGLELTDGRRCALHEGDVLAVVFGNRYASEQFEGYAGADGDRCDLLSMGGLCGLVKSRHAKVAEPTKLRVLGFLGDADGVPLRLQSFALDPPSGECGAGRRPRVVVVCGTAMDSGKTHTAMSLIVGLRRRGHRVAAVKLTGTACGRDTWSMADGGASPVLNFVDGGFGSTYLVPLDQLLDLHRLLLTHAATSGAEWVVVEIADGLLQTETAALLRSPPFTATVDAWVLAAGDPLGALGGMNLLRSLGIEVAAITGLITQSPLSMREAEAATGVRCRTAAELQRGELLGGA